MGFDISREYVIWMEMMDESIGFAWLGDIFTEDDLWSPDEPDLIIIIDVDWTEQ